MINVTVILLALTTVLAIRLKKRVKKLEAWIKASYYSEMDELLTFGAEEAKE